MIRAAFLCVDKIVVAWVAGEETLSYSGVTTGMLLVAYWWNCHVYMHVWLLLCLRTILENFVFCEYLTVSIRFPAMHKVLDRYFEGQHLNRRAAYFLGLGELCQNAKNKTLVNLNSFWVTPFFLARSPIGIYENKNTVTTAEQTQHYYLQLA